MYVREHALQHARSQHICLHLFPRRANACLLSVLFTPSVASRLQAQLLTERGRGRHVLRSLEWTQNATGMRKLKENEVEVMPLSTTQDNTCSNVYAHFFFNPRQLLMFRSFSYMQHVQCGLSDRGMQPGACPHCPPTYSVCPAGAPLVCVAVAED